MGHDANLHRNAQQTYAQTVLFADEAMGVGGEKLTRNDEPGAVLAFARDGDLHVVDHVNARIQRFTADGRYLSSFGRRGSGSGELDLPWGVAVGPDGDVYVGDWRNDRVQRFDSAGRLLGVIGAGVLLRPAGLAVVADATLYVADWGHDRVQVFDTDGRHPGTLAGDAILCRWAAEHLATFPSVATMRDKAARTSRSGASGTQRRHHHT